MRSQKATGFTQPASASQAVSTGLIGPQTIHLPATEIVVDQVRSFELVRIVITASISNIVYLRDVFPDDCYHMRVLESSDPESSYDTFIKGNSHWNKQPGNYAWMVLAKGTNKGVDKILDWLEIGVSEALQKKFLASLQLSFYEGKDRSDVSPENLIEAYTLSITYIDGNASLQLTTKSRSRASFGKRDITLFDTKEGINRAMESNIVDAQAWCRDLPELPENRVADMLLTYTDNCPDGWNATGFKPCNDLRLIIEPESMRARKVATGHHSMQISLYNKFAIPQLPVIGNRARRVVDQTNVVDQTEETVIPKRMSRRREISELSQNDTGATQESGVRAFNDIGGVRDSQSKTQDTQPLQQEPAATQKSSELRAATVSQDIGNVSVPYSQDHLDRLADAREKRKATSVNDPGLDEVQEHEPRIVSCECGDSTDEGDLLQCALCFKSQHSQCYGYLDICPPDKVELICYTCLLAPTEKTLLSEMRLLCLKRRALYFLHAKCALKSAADLTSLAEYLNREKRHAVNVLDQLNKDGMIVIKNLRSTKKGKEKAKSATYTLVEDEEKLNRNYFHPRLKIEHHFALPESSSLGSPIVHESNLGGSSFPAPPGQNILTRNASSPRVLRPEDSSTQGTPSPRPVSKRPADGELEEAGVRKRIHAGFARSPFNFSH